VKIHAAVTLRALKVPENGELADFSDAGAFIV